MDKDFIDNLNGHQYEKQILRILEDKFWIEESFLNRGYRIEVQIHCGIKGDEKHFGNVDTYFHVSKFREEQQAGFGYLQVPSGIDNQGIGKMLMFSVFNILKEFKEYYKIEKRITVGGWLSIADKQNGNWNKSVPLYEKIGRLANVESYFTIGDDKKRYTAEEFLDKANIDGSIKYEI